MRENKDKFIYTSSTLDNKSKYSFFKNKMNIFKEIQMVKSVTKNFINIVMHINFFFQGRSGSKEVFYNTHKLYKSL